MPPVVPGPKFTLNVAEEERREAWLDKHSKRCKMNRGISYTFTPTGIGTNIKLKCLKCGKKKDVTDYGSW